MKRRKRTGIISMLFLGIALILTGCGSGGGDGGGGGTTPDYTIGGTVSGLSGTLELQNNGGNDLTITADGTFTFSTALADGSGYSVAVKTQPDGQTCTVSNGSGTISGANVTNVAVTCSVDTYTGRALSIPSVYKGNATVIYNYYDSNGNQTATTSEQVNIIIDFSEPSTEENNPFHLRIDTIPMLVQGYEAGPGLFNIQSFLTTVTPYPDLKTILWQYWSLKYNSNGFAGSLTGRISEIATAADSTVNFMSIIYYGPLVNVLVDKVIKPGATISAVLDGTSINMKIKGELANIVGGTVFFTIDLQASKQEE